MEFYLSLFQFLVDESSCKLCSASGCQELYEITMGPGVASDSSSTIRVCGPCVLRCRSTAIRVAEHESFMGENDPLSKWYTSFIEGHSKLCDCPSSLTDSKCDFCFTMESLKLLLDQLKPPLERESCKLLNPLGSPLFFGCCRSLPAEAPEEKGIENRYDSLFLFLNVPFPLNSQVFLF